MKKSILIALGAGVLATAGAFFTNASAKADNVLSAYYVNAANVCTAVTTSENCVISQVGAFCTIEIAGDIEQLYATKNTSNVCVTPLRRPQ